MKGSTMNPENSYPRADGKSYIVDLTARARRDALDVPIRYPTF